VDVGLRLYVSAVVDIPDSEIIILTMK